MQSSPPAACPPLCDVTPCTITTLQCSTVQYSTVRDTLYYYNTAVPGPSIVITQVHLICQQTCTSCLTRLGMESTIVQYSEKNLHLLVLRFFANQEDFHQTTHWFFEHASQSYFQERNCVVGTFSNNCTMLSNTAYTSACQWAGCYCGLGASPVYLAAAIASFIWPAIRAGSSL